MISYRGTNSRSTFNFPWHVRKRDALEALASRPEFQQARTINKILDETGVPVTYMYLAAIWQGAYVYDRKNGKPEQFVLPLPYTYPAQMVCLHEYGHYKDDKLTDDSTYRHLIAKRESYKKSPVVRKTVIASEVEAWTNALTTYEQNSLEIPADAWAKMVSGLGLNSYYSRLFKKYEPEEETIHSMVNLLNTIETKVPGFLNQSDTVQLLQKIGA